LYVFFSRGSSSNKSIAFVALPPLKMNLVKKSTQLSGHKDYFEVVLGSQQKGSIGPRLAVKASFYPNCQRTRRMSSALLWAVQRKVFCPLPLDCQISPSTAASLMVLPHLNRIRILLVPVL